jgi:hypothetical protein
MRRTCRHIHPMIMMARAHVTVAVSLNKFVASSSCQREVACELVLVTCRLSRNHGPNPMRSSFLGICSIMMPLAHVHCQCGGKSYDSALSQHAYDC